MSLAALLLSLVPPAHPLAAVRVPEAEQVEVVQVISGDTLRVRRAGGRQEVLHLLSVDAEEPTSGRESDGSKPTTAFGEATMLWVREQVHARSEKDGHPLLRMHLPAGEKRDIYGRLLGHAELLDGSDLALLLVEHGKSPYYTKYGYSRRMHARLLAAQEDARRARRGIWARASEPAQGGEESRPYPQLIAWWNARAEAVEAFRAASAADSERVLEGEDQDALARAAELGGTCELFVEPVRIDELAGEAPRLVLRTRERGRALVVRLDPQLREALAPLAIAERLGTFRQNYLWLVGRVVRERDCWRIADVEPARCRVAGPEPVLSEAQPRAGEQAR